MAYAPTQDNLPSAADPAAPPPPPTLPFSTRSSIFSLRLKTFVYILNVTVVCIGCGCVYGSPAFKSHLRGNSTPQLQWEAKQFKLNPTDYLTLAYNTTCDLCQPQRHEAFLVELQAVMFGVCGFLNILVVGLSVLLHCVSWNNYSTSTIRKIDPCILVLGGAMMGFVTAGIFYPVNQACHLTSGEFDLKGINHTLARIVIIKGIEKSLVEVWTSLCYARWRVDEAIAAMVLGVITCFTYFIVAAYHMSWGLPCSPKLDEIPQNENRFERNMNSGPPPGLSSQPVETPTDSQDIQPPPPPSQPQLPPSS